MNQVMIRKDANTGVYTSKILVAPGRGLTSGSYLQTSNLPGEVTLVSGMLQAGLEEQADKRWKYRSSKGEYVCGDWVDHKGDRYYIDDEGYMVTGWRKIGSKKWYYFKSSIDQAGREGGGQMVLGWREIDGLWYYLHPESVYMMSGWQTIDGKKYYLKKQNEAVNGNDYGYMLTGWREIKNKWYYFHDDGNMAVSEWIEENGERYWVGDDGVWVEGTKKDPVIFEDGEENTVSGDEVWIQCETQGATDFYVKTDIRAEIQVYKDRMFSDKKLYDVTGYLLKQTLSDSAVNNNSNTYLIHVKADSQMMVTCKVNTHTDIYSYTDGAIWTPKANSAQFLTVSAVQSYWYLDNTHVSYMVDLVSHSDFLEYQTKLVNGVIGLETMYFGSYGTKFVKFITTMAGVFTSIQSPVAFKDTVLSEIDEAAGYIGKDSNNFTIYERGACLRHILAVNSGVPYYEVHPWEGSEMEGARGYTGTWKKNN